MFTSQPMTPTLSGLAVEYALALVYSSESGQREATIGFDVGQGTQDLGFRGELPVLFQVRPGIPVRLRIRHHDGTPTVAHFTLTDLAGRIHPPQPKRTAPDLFFQPQVYRADDGIVLLPPGRISVTYGRGPEYRLKTNVLTVPGHGEAMFEFRLERWVDPSVHGFYSGDHHIHAAGCAHYTDPTQGVSPKDMFLQVKGEGWLGASVPVTASSLQIQGRSMSRPRSPSPRKHRLLWPTAASSPPVAEDFWVTPSTCTDPGATASSLRKASPALLNWWLTAARLRSATYRRTNRSTSFSSTFRSNKVAGWPCVIFRKCIPTRST